MQTNNCLCILSIKPLTQSHAHVMGVQFVFIIDDLALPINILRVMTLIIVYPLPAIHLISSCILYCRPFIKPFFIDET